MTPPFVLVEWNDAWTDEGSVTLDNVGATHKPMQVVTAGWLLRDDDVGVSLANEQYDGQFRGRTFILRSMVVSVVPHTLTKPRKKKVKPEHKEES